MRIKSYKSYTDDLMLEKSIGSENIRSKYYSDIDKKIFYRLVNADPTSVRKKDFSKPGKYTKWLIREYKKGNIDEYHIEENEIDRLTRMLFIFSTGWFKSKMRKSAVYVGGENISQKTTDILKYNYSELRILIDSYDSEFRAQTENAKFDTVYADDKINILIPINFTASYEIAKDTDWCSKYFSGFSMVNKASIPFRLIPVDNSKDRLKISWGRNNGTWYIACSRYPEINGKGSPFEIKNGIEKWLNVKLEYDEIYKTNLWKENSIKIEETMNLLSNDAKKCIIKYYSKHNLNNE